MTALRASTPRTSPGGTALRILLVALAALVLGGLTSPAQQVLPAAVNSFANSAGGWTLLTVLLLLAARARPLLSAVLGAVAFVLLVEGYRIVSGWRGFPYGPPFQNQWTVVGLLAGPVLGLSVALWRSRRPWLHALSVVPVAAVLVGEGLYGLTVIAPWTSPVWWSVQIAAGVLIAALVLRRRPIAPLPTACAVAAVAIGSALFCVAAVTIL